MNLTRFARRALVSVVVAGAVLAPSVASAAITEAVPVGREVFIDHVQTGEHLTPNGFATSPTAFVDLWEDHNNVFYDAEKWVYEYVNGSYETFRIRNAGGDVCLEPATVEYRKIVSTKKCSDSSAQWWYLWNTDTGVRNGFTIRPFNDTSLAITPVTVPTHNDQYTVLSPVGDYMNQVFRNRVA